MNSIINSDPLKVKYRSWYSGKYCVFICGKNENGIGLVPPAFSKKALKKRMNSACVPHQSHTLYTDLSVVQNEPGLPGHGYINWIVGSASQFKIIHGSAIVEWLAAFGIYHRLPPSLVGFSQLMVLASILAQVVLSPLGPQNRNVGGCTGV